MSPEKAKKIHLIYGWIAAALILILGIALIASCLDIYNSGPRPYNPESISLRFQRIALLVYICIALVVGGIALGLFLPMESQKPKARKDAGVALSKLRAKSPAPEGKLASAIRKERTVRMLLRGVTAVIYVALMIGPCLYFLDTSHFTIASVNSDILRAVCIALLPAAVGLLLCFVCGFWVNKSILRETALYKQVIASAQSITLPAEPQKQSNSPKIIVRCVVLAAAVVLLVLGAINGGMKDVLDKAVAICTECIGLG